MQLGFAGSLSVPYLHCMDLRLLDTIRQSFSPQSSRRELAIDGFHRAGVLVPIIAGRGDCSFLLTQRTQTVETHKGQVSFPGGMTDAMDIDIVATALRELAEETGIRKESVEIIGLLDDQPVPTGFVVTPVVGLIASEPKIVPSVDEVAEVFQVPLSYFMTPVNGRMELREFRGAKHEVWFYEFEGRNIWGATALMIRSLLKRTGLLDRDS